VRIAILGGSFNPIHLGHLCIAESALALGYGRVVLIPAYRSPFKPNTAATERNAQDRLEMIAASIADDPRLSLDDCEIRREGVSYTVDTTGDIIRRYSPQGKIGLIIGDDLAADFPRWNRSEEILRMADIIIARRLHSAGMHYPFPNTPVDNEVLAISSALVRERIGAGAAWRYLVPAGARDIIEERGLYGLRKDAPPGQAAEEISHKDSMRIEAAARESLSLERFIHSRNTALLAWDLCRRFGLDPSMGYLAGMAHDLGKNLDSKTLLRLAAQDGKPLSPLEKKKPSLLHGRAAAVLLRERFGIHNKDVLEAVALHTGGGPDMEALAKVVYIADKLEPSREKADPALRAMCYESADLDSIFFAVLDDTVSWLRSRKAELSEETFRLLEKMKGRKK
jgi:nicotinate-nucleotide adenylyltransferase